MDENNLKKTTKIGALVTPELKTVLEKFQKKNSDVFAWYHEDMPGIDPDLMVLKLNVDPNHKPVHH